MSAATRRRCGARLVSVPAEPSATPLGRAQVRVLGGRARELARVASTRELLLLLLLL